VNIAGRPVASPPSSQPDGHGLTPLLHLLVPDPDLTSDRELYVRTTKGACVSRAGGLVDLAAGGSASFDTYFNSFGVGKWLRHTQVRNVVLTLQACGSFRAEVVHQRVGRPGRVVACAEVQAATAAVTEIEVPELSRLEDGAVYLRITALGTPAVVESASWQTRDPRRRSVRLGVVITTFRRPGPVQANLDRLARSLVVDRDDVRLVIVDNGSDFVGTLPDGIPTSVLSNPNLGGAGGFARGLMHLRDEGWATHAVFMDDDVSFEPELLTRTIELLAPATDPHLCIAGAMLTDGTPTRITEAGGRFDATSVMPVRPVHEGCDATSWLEVLGADVDEPIDYGAWWYFAFPLDLARANPLPVFLRGDDVAWSLMHARPHIVSFNGIGLWHDSFDLKSGPSYLFYDMRNFALVSVLCAPDYRARHLVRRYVSRCGRNLLSFKYSSAASLTAAVRAFLEGPEEWLRLDHTELHQTVRDDGDETVRPLEAWEAAVPDLPLGSGLPRKGRALLSLLTLGGNLLPAALRRQSPIGERVHRQLLGRAARRNEIVFHDDARTVGFVARRDRRRFFSLLGRMLCTTVLVGVRFRRVRRAYLAAYPALVSDEYWTRQFGDVRPEPVTAASA